MFKDVRTYLFLYYTPIIILCQYIVSGILYRGDSVFFFLKNHELTTEINPVNVCSVAENITVINHTCKLILFIPCGIIVGRITFYHCNQYVCFHHDIVCKSSWKRLIYVHCMLDIWLTIMEYMCHKWPRLCSTCRKHFQVLSSFTTYYRVCN